MGWDCIIKGKEIDEVRKDKRTAKNVEKYSISEKAVYFDNKYLPVNEIKSLRVQPSMYTPQGCCGKGIPVFKIRVDYGEEKPVVLMVEKESNAQKAIELITGNNPDIVIEEYINPVTGEPAKPMRTILG